MNEVGVSSDVWKLLEQHLHEFRLDQSGAEKGILKIQEHVVRSVQL